MAERCRALRIVELLLQRGAAVDLCAPDDPNGTTALERACAARHPSVVRRLLHAGASLELRSVRTVRVVAALGMCV